MTTEEKTDAAEPSWQESIELLDQLPGLPLEERVEVIERLVRNSSPGIRGRALRMGAAVLSDDVLTSYLRNDGDGVIRNSGLEMLKMRGNKGFALAVQLLSDPDFDVALQAVLILDHIKDPRALEPLRAQLRHSDPNVVQAVITAIGQLGDARTIPDLLPFLKADSWLQIAAVEALGDIRSPVAVDALQALLTDLIIGPIAAEALARIGGPQAFRCLAEHWLRFQQELDAETTLGLLAHILEGLEVTPAPVPGFLDSLVENLDHEQTEVQLAVGRCLLVLGPGDQDARCLALLVTHTQHNTLLPACLARRTDLLPGLLAAPDVRRAWGFLLCSRYPNAVPVAELAAALSPPLETGWLELIVEALEEIREREVSEALLNLYLALPPERRGDLTPLFRKHQEHLRSILEERDDLPLDGQLVLAALLGEPSESVVRRIEALNQQDRLRVIGQLSDQEAVVRRLPWARWLAEKPEVYASLAAEVAVEAGLRDLLPPLRVRLAESPSPELIRAMGELGDRESVPIMVEILHSGRVEFEPVILESLGRIGGPEVRQALREAASTEDAGRARIAYKALSLCATEDDDAFFRQAVNHNDWYIRLACADVLGRFQRPENLAVLAQLAADPVPIVAQRALSFLESEGGAK
jgi:HEAT repeat protein